jgi:hypothetical protein
MYKPSAYLEVGYFPTYLPIYEIYVLRNWLPRWNQILTLLRFIHNWIITDIQWMLRWWVLVHFGPCKLKLFVNIKSLCCVLQRFACQPFRMWNTSNTHLMIDWPTHWLWKCVQCHLQRDVLPNSRSKSSSCWPARATTLILSATKYA